MVSPKQVQENDPLETRPGATVLLVTRLQRHEDPRAVALSSCLQSPLNHQETAKQHDSTYLHEKVTVDSLWAVNVAPKDWWKFMDR